jgi:hypothetical protein
MWVLKEISAHFTDFQCHAEGQRYVEGNLNGDNVIRFLFSSHSFDSTLKRELKRIKHIAGEQLSIYYSNVPLVSFQTFTKMQSGVIFSTISTKSETLKAASTPVLGMKFRHGSWYQSVHRIFLLTLLGTFPTNKTLSR